MNSLAVPRIGDVSPRGLYVHVRPQDDVAVPRAPQALYVVGAKGLPSARSARSG